MLDINISKNLVASSRELVKIMQTKCKVQFMSHAELTPKLNELDPALEAYLSHLAEASFYANDNESFDFIKRAVQSLTLGGQCGDHRATSYPIFSALLTAGTIYLERKEYHEFLELLRTPHEVVSAGSRQIDLSRYAAVEDLLGDDAANVLKRIFDRVVRVIEKVSLPNNHEFYVLLFELLNNVIRGETDPFFIFRHTPGAPGSLGFGVLSQIIIAEFDEVLDGEDELKKRLRL